ncbi:hypothetical protein L6164_016145 [Bauhinia variegata]|uniref:Uncharacterized protein n=1 Tax=Bauhinia variegata TaxID=167791 RepID=A0ACB9NMT4_BAUVA|nr:hypothetical protein L6164_016145 [Bauhinia variegata]
MSVDSRDCYSPQLLLSDCSDSERTLGPFPYVRLVGPPPPMFLCYFMDFKRVFHVLSFANPPATLASLL